MTNEEVIIEWKIKNGLETPVEKQLRLALDHLDKVLNGCRSASEQLTADTVARGFLLECGR